MWDQRWWPRNDRPMAKNFNNRWICMSPSKFHHHSHFLATSIFFHLFILAYLGPHTFSQFGYFFCIEISLLIEISVCTTHTTLYNYYYFLTTKFSDCNITQKSASIFLNKIGTVFIILCKTKPTQAFWNKVPMDLKKKLTEFSPDWLTD